MFPNGWEIKGFQASTVHSSKVQLLSIESFSCLMLPFVGNAKRMLPVTRDLVKYGQRLQLKYKNRRAKRMKLGSSSIS